MLHRFKNILVSMAQIFGVTLLLVLCSLFVRRKYEVAEQDTLWEPSPNAPTITPTYVAATPHSKQPVPSLSDQTGAGAHSC